MLSAFFYVSASSNQNFVLTKDVKNAILIFRTIFVIIIFVSFYITHNKEKKKRAESLNILSSIANEPSPSCIVEVYSVQKQGIYIINKLAKTKQLVGSDKMSNHYKFSE